MKTGIYSFTPWGWYGWRFRSNDQALFDTVSTWRDYMNVGAFCECQWWVKLPNSLVFCPGHKKKLE